MTTTRRRDSQSNTIASGAAISDVIDMRSWAGGSVLLPAAWTAANIGFKTCNTSGGTFAPLYDADGSIIEIASPAAAKVFTFPADVYNAGPFIKLWSQDGSGNDTNQAAARTLTVYLVT